MKKIFSLIITLTIMFLLALMQSNAADVNKQINANIKTKRVPSGTVITLKVLDPISSSKALGDQFGLMVVDNVTVDNSVVIPKGSFIRGSIEEVQAPKMLYKGGLVRLYFDHIVSSTGKQVPFYAGIANNRNVTYDGALSSKTNYSTALAQTAQTTKDIVVKSTEWSWDKGGDMLNGTPKYVLAPLTAIVSVPVAGVYFIGGAVADIFKKGKDININQGDTIQVQLLKPLDMPVY